MADTIAAIATASGRGGIGVVRLSGRDLRPFVQAITGRFSLEPRVATLSNFLDVSGEVIDQGVVLFFPAPHSFTGEDVIELQGHGGPVVMNLLLKRCLELGARLAEPGEFTRRAYLNDKIDLAQAESVADLIDAASVAAAKSAVRSLRGDFSHAIHILVEKLINLRLLVEVTLDFPEEEVEFLTNGDIFCRLDEIADQLLIVYESARQGSLMREGMHIILIGQPNVGKSSLLNRLAGEEVAIVTPIAGTTRDAIHQHIEIEGAAMHFYDTAGLRETQDVVEQVGIARTWATIEQANVAVLMVDAGQGITDADLEIISKLPPSLPIIRAFNKIDRYDLRSYAEKHETGTDIYLSAKTGEGLDLLKKQLLDVIGWCHGGEGVFLARERHLQALQEARRRLVLARDTADHIEFMAEELRLAQEALSRITGEFSSDDLLGEIFSRFCIGK
jgi:tRNA modification GTPase